MNMQPTPDNPLSGGPPTDHLPRIAEVLTEPERLLANRIGRGNDRPAAVPARPLTRPQWLFEGGLTDQDWRSAKSMLPGAVMATFLAEQLERGTIVSIVMADVGVFPQAARRSDSEWVPDRVTIDGVKLSVRGELAVIGLTPYNQLVRFVVFDVPLGRLGDAEGETFQRKLIDDLAVHVRPDSTPLGALGLAGLPLWVRPAPTIAVRARRPGVKESIGLDQLPAQRTKLERCGVKVLAELEDDRSKLLADLAPLERDRHGRVRVSRGPRVILSDGITRRLRQGELPGIGRHRTSLDDDALDGQSFLGVYGSGLGLADERGNFEPVAVAHYQMAVPRLFMLGNWDLTGPIGRQELAAAVHHVSDPELKVQIRDCRARARAWVDRRRPALRDPEADSLAAGIEHQRYASLRLAEMAHARA